MKHYRMEIISILVSHGRLSLREMAELTRRPLSGVKGTIKLMRNIKMVHIAGYVRKKEGERGAPHPMFALGDKPDAPKLKPLSKREYQMRHYRRKKKPAVDISYEDLGVWRGLI